MGLSNILSAGGDQGGAVATVASREHPWDYFESKYPIAGGLAHAVFGNNQASTPTTPVSVDAPLPQMPNPPAPDYSMLNMNVRPQQGGGGLGAILKLIGL